MAGTGRIYVTAVRAVGDIQSTHQYDVDVRFDIAFDWGGYNYNGGAYTISCDGQNTNGTSTFAVGSGGGSWVWVNIGDTKTFRITMPASGQAKTINLSAGINTGVNPSYISASGSYTLPAVTWQWAVSYNANGGTGAPGAQTKTYGTDLTLSGTIPSRTGYTFLGWSTSDSATSATYSAGGTYSANSAVTLYAVWKINTYTVSYNANGGTGAPGAQTKTYGTTLTLSKTIPTRTNYNFKGWATSSTATSATYSAGGAYTANSGIVLYAVWELAYTKPRIYSESVSRCDANGNLTDSGTYVVVKFSWSTDKTVSAIEIMWKTLDATGYQTSNTISVTASGTSGTVSKIIGSGGIDAEKSYNIKIQVTDSVDSSAKTIAIGTMNIPLDFKQGGNGVAIGKPAELDGLFEVDYIPQMNKPLRLGKYIDQEQTFEGGIKIHDLRNATPTPGMFGDYVMNAYFHKKGLPNSRWSAILSMSGWTAKSEGYATHELAFNATSDVNDKALYHRTGKDGIWQSWREILDSGNYASYAMPQYPKTITGLPSDNASYVWRTDGNGLGGNVTGWNLGSHISTSWGDGAFVAVNSNNELSWGFRSSGSWIGTRKIGANKVLWTGAWYMNAAQTATLSEAISAQVNGIVLMFSLYNPSTGAVGQTFNYAFVPKYFVSAIAGQSSNFPMISSQYGNIGHKMLYINDTQIVGHAANVTSGTTNGVTFNNMNFVLRYVIGI